VWFWALALIVGLMGRPALADDCLPYGENVTLHGVGDEPESCAGAKRHGCDGSLIPRLFLKLAKPICTQEDKKNPHNQAEVNISNINLFFQPFDHPLGWVADFPPGYDGKDIAVSGTLADYTYLNDNTAIAGYPQMTMKVSSIELETPNAQP
jgi:hypothetical protein